MFGHKGLHKESFWQTCTYLGMLFPPLFYFSVYGYLFFTAFPSFTNLQQTKILFFIFNTKCMCIHAGWGQQITKCINECLLSTSCTMPVSHYTMYVYWVTIQLHDRKFFLLQSFQIFSWNNKKYNKACFHTGGCHMSLLSTTFWIINKE